MWLRALSFFELNPTLGVQCVCVCVCVCVCECVCLCSSARARLLAGLSHFILRILIFIPRLQPILRMTQNMLEDVMVFGLLML